MTWYFYDVGDYSGHAPIQKGKTHRSATLKNALARAYQMVKYEHCETIHVTNKIEQTRMRYTKSMEFRPYNVPYVVYDDSPYNRPMTLYVVRTKNGIKRLMADGTMRELK